MKEATEHRPRGGGWRFITPPADKLHEPVVRISWYNAVAYSNWLSAQSGQNYRLPTEAEWEKAAQLGMISGGICEWTSTIWGYDANAATYPYGGDGQDNLMAAGDYRIWRRFVGYTTVTDRGFASPISRLKDLGLRVVIVIESV